MADASARPARKDEPKRAVGHHRQLAHQFDFSGQARDIATGLVAHVTNGVDYDGEPFHKGPEDADVSMLTAISHIASV